MAKTRRNRISEEQSGGSNAQTDMQDALLLKRADLTRGLKELDAVIAQLREEYTLRLEQLQAQKKPLEDALYHVEALLRFEGCQTSAIPPIIENISITDAAFNLLEEIQQPLHYKEIAAILQDRNIYIPGVNPAATLLSRMSRDNRFKRTKKRGTYALSTWRVRSTKAADILIDGPRENMDEVVRNKRPGSQEILLTQPWNQASLFASGICYGKN
ncbi:MAG: winged helix-turn-helix domain-containing protein [Dehalococcoidia bacterium]|nr:MAG: winged helix-turn-helix domain-containing protein [Dehalococcoidia bacterium]